MSNTKSGVIRIPKYSVGKIVFIEISGFSRADCDSTEVQADKRSFGKAKCSLLQSSLFCGRLNCAVVLFVLFE